MPGRCAALLAAAAGLAVPLASAADSIRCDGGIVSGGDPKIDLIGKCGPPALQEVRHLDRAGYVLGGLAERARVVSSVETWSYDFGPRRFLQIVTIERGRVVAIERGGGRYAAGAAAGRPGGPVATPGASPPDPQGWPTGLARSPPAASNLVRSASAGRSVPSF